MRSRISGAHTFGARSDDSKFRHRLAQPEPFGPLLLGSRVDLAAATRLELVHPRLQDECSVIQLSYAAIWWTGRDSNPHKKFAGLLCCRLHHQPENISDCQFLIADYVSGREPINFERAQSEIGNRKSKMFWWLWVDLNHQPRAYETLALFHLSYTAVNDLGSPRRS